MPLQIFSKAAVSHWNNRGEQFLTQDAGGREGQGFGLGWEKERVEDLCFQKGVFVAKTKTLIWSKSPRKGMWLFSYEGRRLNSGFGRIGVGNQKTIKDRVRKQFPFSFFFDSYPIYNLLHFLTKEESVPFVLVLHPIDLYYSMNPIVPTTLTSDDNLLHDGLSSLDKEQ
jgi:hypothetical protein